MGNDKYHVGLEGITLPSKKMPAELPLTGGGRPDVVHIKIDKSSSYNFVAYPGPAVVDAGRAEHCPLHFHVKHPGRELRILIDSFEEMDGLFVPKKLVKYFRDSAVRNLLSENTRSVYETGKLIRRG